MTDDLVVLAEVLRSGRVESVHRGAVVVADASGSTLAAAGDPRLSTYLRSAAKPLQLLTMLEEGLEREIALSGEELALCAASHGGEPEHVAGVQALLARAGLSTASLRCGAAPPLDRAAHERLLRRGGTPEAVHNNCSGKHAAMLITSRANGWGLEDYQSPLHPLQTRIAYTIAQFAGESPLLGVDGCGVPTFYLSLLAAARMTAALMERAAAGGAAHRVVHAMTGHPWHTSGSQRLAYRVMAAVPGLLAKEGAEGLFTVGVGANRSPWGRPVGVALKVADGAGEDARGREPAVAAVLLALGVASGRELAVLEALAHTPVRNSPGDVVGEVRGARLLLTSRPSDDPLTRNDRLHRAPGGWDGRR